MKEHETYLIFCSYLSEYHISHVLFGAVYYMDRFAILIKHIQSEIIFIGGFALRFFICMDRILRIYYSENARVKSGL